VLASVQFFWHAIRIKKISERCYYNYFNPS
jgi:hypothetical protein